MPLPVEELMAIDESLPRNPVLAKFFRVAQLCESGGYGFNKMLEWKKQTGNDVIFETAIGKTTFTFMIDTTKTIREESNMEGGTLSSTIDNKSGTENEKTVEKTVEKILHIIKEKPEITQKELMIITGLTRRGVEWNILQLKNNGIIRREGADKGGKWILLKNTND